MKYKSLLLVLGVAFSGVSQLALANSADLLITGKLVPPSCTPTLSGGAVIDYGDIQVSELGTNAATTLEDRKVSLTVTCLEETALGIRITDARSESKPLLITEIPMPTNPAGSHAVAFSNNQTMGLGNDVAMGKLGVWWLSMEFDKLKATNKANEEVGETGKLLYSINNGISWGETITTPLDPHYGGDNVTTFAIKGKTTSTPAVAVVHEFPMVVAAALNIKGRLNVKDDTKLDGKGTFTIYYQ